MSESETPIDQNTTGGEPVPPNEEENDIEVTEVNENGDSDDGDDSDNEDDDDDDDDDDDSEEDEDDDDDEEDFMAQLPKSVRHRVEKLKELNGKRDEIMEDYLKERAALEKKFSDLCKPLYDERGDIIAGKKDEEISAAVAASKLNQKEEGGGKINNDDDSDDDDEGLVGIPEFWTCCIHNIEAISELVTERDNACLLYLENITCEDFEDGKGFELKFYFKEDNPYFSNKILTKRCKFTKMFI
jgi:nucleosome assembly protein 1-like 1